MVLALPSPRFRFSRPENLNLNFYLESAKLVVPGTNVGSSFHATLASMVGWGSIGYIIDSAYSFRSPDRVLTLEDRLRNPFTESMARRQYSQAALYRAALADTRYSSGFGMYPPIVKPRQWGAGAWLVFKFGFVGGLGLFLNVYLMYVLSQISLLTNALASLLGGSVYLVYAVLSSQGAVLVNFLLNESLVFRGRKTAGKFLTRFTFFNSIASADLLVRIPLLWGFTTFLGVPALLSNLESILLTFVGRFIISVKKIWPKPAKHG